MIYNPLNINTFNINKIMIIIMGNAVFFTIMYSTHICNKCTKLSRYLGPAAGAFHVSRSIRVLTALRAAFSSMVWAASSFFSRRPRLGDS